MDIFTFQYGYKYLSSMLFFGHPGLFLVYFLILAYGFLAALKSSPYGMLRFQHITSTQLLAPGTPQHC